MPWANEPNVTAILAAHLPGQESANSILDILYGTINPSSKLPHTIAVNDSDYSFADITNFTELQHTEDQNAWQSSFTEALLIDYRHFDYYNQSVAFELGFGLSYTALDMCNLDIQPTIPNMTLTPYPDSVAAVPGGNPTLWGVIYTANSTVAKTSSLAGATVPQVYLSLPQTPNSVPTPTNVLRGFEKTHLEPNESQSVVFPLMRRDLSYWDVGMQEWVTAGGAIGVNVGFSSRGY